jgi:hypothetical protein
LANSRLRDLYKTSLICTWTKLSVRIYAFFLAAKYPWLLSSCLSSLSAYKEAHVWEQTWTCHDACETLLHLAKRAPSWIRPWQIFASLKVPLHPSVLAPTQFYQSSSLSCTPILSYAHKRVWCAISRPEI